MRTQGYKDSTIRSTVSALKAMARRTDLLDPDSVKGCLASAPLTEGRKEKVCEDLARFYSYFQIHWDRPRYRRVEKLPFIPQEEEVDALIAGCGNKTATFLQLLKETGVRPGEAWNLKWTDFDFQQNSVTITPEKSSSPRRPRISTWMKLKR